MPRHGAVVVGGGQAGLATSYALQRLGVDHVVLDAAAAPGEAWRLRWDSLRLFTPIRHSSLPGLDLPGDPSRLPGKDEVADYLATYARRFDLPVQRRTSVTGLSHGPDGFEVRTAAGADCLAQVVVVATGAFQIPSRPVWAGKLADSVTQVHTSRYRNPRQLPDGTTVVVGGGNSGVQIAAELAESGRDVHLAVGSSTPAVPQRPLGVDLFTWIHLLRLHTVSSDSRLGKRMAANSDVIVGPGPGRLSHELGITLAPRAVDAEAATICFDDGARTVADAVVWATGFRTDDSWIDVDGAVDSHGRGLHRLGRSPTPGLYYIGRKWQRTLGSALLGGVGQDAAELAEELASRQER